jgi:hypothetical protein
MTTDTSNLPKIEPIHEKGKKQKHKYIFPNFLAKSMAKVNEKTQYESSMMSMFFILLGILFTSLYLIIFQESFNLWMKIMTGVNGFFAFVFISSYLVTTYQQYVVYMNAIQSFSQEEPKRKTIFSKIKNFFMMEVE